MRVAVTDGQFQNVAGTGLYWLTSSGRTLGFLTAVSSPPAQLSLEQSWADATGVYLLLAAAPTAPDGDFAPALLGYVAALGMHPRFLWLVSTSGAWQAWQGTAMAVTSVTGGWQVLRRADFTIGSYTLTIPGETAVALNDSIGFAFTGTGGDAAGMLRAPGGTYAATGQLLLPLTSGTPGAFGFSVSLPNGAAAPTDLERLAVGIRYFFPDPDEAAAVAVAEAGDDAGVPRDVHVRALALPALRQTSGPLGLAWTLDPLRPLDPTRTAAAFTVPGGGALRAFGSGFATARGYGVGLTPDSGARLVFAVQPLFVGASDVPVDYYLTPQGVFGIDWLSNGGSSTDDGYRLLCGASGLEYLGMPAASASELLFVPGGAAFCDMKPAATPDAGTLTTLGTTAWLYANTSPGAVDYYAQPEDAPLYQAPASTATSSFLDFLELPSFPLPAPDGERAFPAAPYGGLLEADVTDALAIEAQGIAPARRRKLLELAGESLPGASGTPGETVGVTPQGLAVGVAGDGMSWSWLGVANQTAGADAPDLRFTAVSTAFQQAVETNRAFAVLRNAETFVGSGASVAYRLDAEAIAAVRAGGRVRPDVLAAVSAAMLGRSYGTETDFVNALHAASSGTAGYELDFERVAGTLDPVIAGWNFRLSPRNWANPDRLDHKYGTLIFKLATDRTLRELTDDLAAWCWHEVSVSPGPSGTTEQTQKELRSFFADAEDADRRARETGRESAYADFVALLDDERWTGILALSCEVPLDRLPEPLQALAAGIDPNRFYAHHVGFNLTPFQASPGALSFSPTSMFGLIDYQDPDDQVLDEETFFAFKVLRLTVGFRNSQIASFASRVELMVNRLFGARTHLWPTEHGNNVILDGVYQHQPGPDGSEQGTYVFAASRQNTLRLDDSALRAVVLRSTQLVTAKAANPDDENATTIAHFVIGGDMHFFENEKFDAFSFGVDDHDPAADPAGSHLRFGNLIVEMQFEAATRVPTFTLVTETLSFDTTASKPRPKSLYATFPIRLSGFVATPDPQQLDAAAPPDEESKQKPESLGFASISAPIQQSRLRDPWFGIEYAIDLGTLGALSGGSQITLTLLVAWSGGGTLDQPAVYIGVRLPGMKGALGVDLPLQGVMTLGFKAVEFLASDSGLDSREHILRFRNFALRFFGIPIPPGHNDILLFGNRSQTGSTKVGWYAAYSVEEDEKKKKRLSPESALAARRQGPALPRREV